MYCSGVDQPAASRLRKTQLTGERDVESRGDLAVLPPSDGIDPRLVGRPCTAGALGDIQTDAGRSAHCLIPQAAHRDCRFTDSIEKLSRLLVSDQLFEWKISKVRHRRLLSKAEQEPAMTNDWNPVKQPRRRRRFFLSQNAGASDNAEGVGARLPFPLPLPLPVFLAVGPYLMSIGASGESAP